MRGKGIQAGRNSVSKGLESSGSCQGRESCDLAGAQQACRDVVGRKLEWTSEPGGGSNPSIRQGTWVSL